jgi:hypothetical protein
VSVLLALSGVFASSSMARVSRSEFAAAPTQRSRGSTARAQRQSAVKPHDPRCSKGIAKYTVCVSAGKGLTMGGIQNSLQNALFGFAKDQLEGFLLNKYGLGKIIDPYGPRLDAITTQLKSIDSQVAQVQLSINNT